LPHSGCEPGEASGSSFSNAFAPLEAPLVVPAADEDHRVIITIKPACLSPDAPSERLPGRWLSDAEQLVWKCLGPDEWLVGKEIAARCGREHDTKLRYLLMNLEDRGVLLHEDGRGYARAGMP